MYRTAKHELLMSGPMKNKSVYDLPGIGKVRGGRLENVGIRTADQLASLYERMGRDRFESFLNTTCGQNSLWTGMTIAALAEYNQTNVSFTLPPKRSTMPAAPEKSIQSSNGLQKATVSKGRARCLNLPNTIPIPVG